MLVGVTPAERSDTIYEEIAERASKRRVHNSVAPNLASDSSVILGFLVTEDDFVFGFLEDSRLLR